ncbi:hypothetical protein HanIR_Chr01g0050481 [Helianthus annuus]|nr:hypothetical protein HanIR_Chr01g0050481 [Helianthus annuus]
MVMSPKSVTLLELFPKIASSPNPPRLFEPTPMAASLTSVAFFPFKHRVIDPPLLSYSCASFCSFR